MSVSPLVDRTSRRAAAVPLPPTARAAPGNAAALSSAATCRSPPSTARSPYGHLDHAASTPALESVKAAVDRALLTYSSVHRGAGSCLAGDERLVRAGSRGGGAPSSAPAPATRSSSPGRRPTREPAGRALPARTTVFVFAERAPLDPAAVGPVPDGPAAHPAHDRGRGGAARGGAATTRPSTGSSWSPRPPTSRARSGRSSASPPSPTSTAPGSPSTPRSSRRTAASTSAAWTPTTWPSPGTRPTPRSARESWPAAPTGSTPARRPLRRRCHPGRRRGGHRVGGRSRAARGRQPQRRRRHRAGRGVRDDPGPSHAIEAHEETLLERLRSGLERVDGVEQLSIFDDAHDRVGVVAFTVDGFDPLAGVPDPRRRARHRRAGREVLRPPARRRARSTTPWGESPRAAVRASIGLATTVEAVDRLVAALSELTTLGPRATWTHGPQGWAVEGDDPERTSPRAPGSPARPPARAGRAATGVEDRTRSGRRGSWGRGAEGVGTPHDRVVGAVHLLLTGIHHDETAAEDVVDLDVGRQPLPDDRPGAHPASAVHALGVLEPVRHGAEAGVPEGRVEVPDEHEPLVARLRLLPLLQRPEAGSPVGDIGSRRAARGGRP